MHLSDFVVCEDIRFEIGNKVTLIGVFSEEITISASPPSTVIWPLAIRMAVFARVRVEPTRIPDRFRISIMHDSKTVGAFDGPLVVARPERPIHLTVMNQIVMPSPGHVSFKIDLDSGREHLGTLEPEFAFDLRIKAT